MRLVRYLPAALACVVAAGRAAKLETRWPLKGSTWQSVARARPTEIDYLNGEIVRAGRETGVPKRLNEFVMTLFRRVESEQRYLTAHEIAHALMQERWSEQARGELGVPG